MWCAYFFAILALIGFPYSNLNAHDFVSWLSQTFIQLTMLSILSVAQRLSTEQAKNIHKEHIKLAKKYHEEQLVHHQRTIDKLGIK